jgi:DNA-binding response OmpR family regulator
MSRHRIREVVAAAPQFLAGCHHGPVQTRILAVEDDPRIVRALSLALADEGHEVTGAETAESALDGFDPGQFDLVLVDLMLPGISGFDLCRRLRQTSDIPIIVVTARSDTHDVVAGLEAGADDYVTKPFETKELAARIRSLLRRTRSARPTESAPQMLGDLELLPEAGLVRRNGEPIPLTKTEFFLLCELAEHRGMVLSREQLLERVWGYDYFGDSRLVDAHIRRLRTKVEIDPSRPEIIHTVRGLGYRLDA